MKVLKSILVKRREPKELEMAVMTEVVKVAEMPATELAAAELHRKPDDLGPKSREFGKRKSGSEKPRDEGDEAQEILEETPTDHASTVDNSPYLPESGQIEKGGKDTGTADKPNLEKSTPQQPNVPDTPVEKSGSSTPGGDEAEPHTFTDEAVQLSLDLRNFLRVTGEEDLNRAEGYLNLAQHDLYRALDLYHKDPNLDMPNSEETRTVQQQEISREEEQENWYCPPCGREVLASKYPKHEGSEEHRKNCRRGENDGGGGNGGGNGGLGPGGGGGGGDDGNHGGSGGGGTGSDGDTDEYDSDPDDLYCGPNEPMESKVEQDGDHRPVVLDEHMADENTGAAPVPALFEYALGNQGGSHDPNYRGDEQQSTQAPRSLVEDDEAGSQRQIPSNQGEEDTVDHGITGEDFPRDPAPVSGPAQVTSSNVPDFNTVSTNAPKGKIPTIEKVPIEPRTNREEGTSEEAPPKAKDNISGTQEKNTDTDQSSKPVGAGEQLANSESQQEVVNLEDNPPETALEEHNGGQSAADSGSTASAHGIIKG
ncbi:hypothetical protein PMIN05_008891 [Paraphaeosphaeria minitans]